jgi:DNA repair photolyase
MKRPGDWFGHDENMNIYRGCNHGCIYCDSRSLCYRNPDFDTVKVKEDALRIVRDDLRRRVKKGVVGTGAMSDPYNSFERELLYTRHALELIDAFGFGASIATKSDLVTRDIDILKSIGEHSPVLVKLTVTSMDEALCRITEPFAPSPAKRMEAVRTLSQAGIPCGILLMPLLPMLGDTEENISAITTAASAAGARFVYPSMGMTLRDGNREYYYAKLNGHFPGLSEKYQKTYGSRYVCGSRRSKALWEHFKARCDELGLLYNMRDIIRSYRGPYEQEQLTLNI